MSNCDYHPNNSVWGKCSNCGKYVCQIDKRVYKKVENVLSQDLKKQRVSETNYCVICYADRVINENTGGQATTLFVLSVILPIVAVIYWFINDQSFFGPDIVNSSVNLLVFSALGFFFIYAFFKRFILGPRLSKAAEKDRDQFLASLS